jgi:hypothetical protein
MKHLTIEHMNSLDALKEEAFLEECVASLIEIDYPNAYSENKDEYLNFVKHVFEVCKEYDLTNKKHAFSLMLLWYMKGDELLKEEEFSWVLKATDISAHKKADYFDAYIDEILEKEEGEVK